MGPGIQNLDSNGQKKFVQGGPKFPCEVCPPGLSTVGVVGELARYPVATVLISTSILALHVGLNGAQSKVQCPQAPLGSDASVVIGLLIPNLTFDLLYLLDPALGPGRHQRCAEARMDLGGLVLVSCGE